MADVFISYAREDMQFVSTLRAALKTRELDVWVDLEGLYAGEEYWPAICSAIEDANSAVFVISPDWITSKPCQQELEHALKHNKRLLPIIRRDVPDGDVPPTLASRQWTFLRETDDFHKSLKI